MLLTVEEVMGSAEIGKLLGVSRQRVQQLIARPDFPAPATTLAMGKIWLAVDVRAWVKANRTALAERTEVAPIKRAVRRPPAKPAGGQGETPPAST